MTPLTPRMWRTILFSVSAAFFALLIALVFYPPTRRVSTIFAFVMMGWNLVMAIHLYRKFGRR